MHFIRSFDAPRAHRSVEWKVTDRLLANSFDERPHYVIVIPVKSKARIAANDNDGDRALFNPTVHRQIALLIFHIEVITSS